ncbi:MAG: sulfite exporter TauE/SafE family protein [Bacteroidales bacterium]|nr:sulfite exporter TauE/SafE family protein [Bacteroidales bacterium]
MVDFINPLNVSWGVWFVTLFAAFLAGLSKSGIKGIVMIAIPVLANIYGAKESTGILLPFLIFGDLFALNIFYKSCKIKIILKLLPYAVIGVLIAVFVGNRLDNRHFSFIIASILLVCVILILYFDLTRQKVSIFEHRIVSPLFGLGGGFATMMGNLAGPIFNLYLVSMKLPKKEFIGTGALFFLILNLFKVPFHFFSWGSITTSSLQMNIVMVPAIYIGSLLGSKIVNYISDNVYRYFILIVTSISAVLLFFK